MNARELDRPVDVLSVEVRQSDHVALRLRAKGPNANVGHRHHLGEAYRVSNIKEDSAQARNRFTLVLHRF